MFELLHYDQTILSRIECIYGRELKHGNYGNKKYLRSDLSDQNGGVGMNGEIVLQLSCFSHEGLYFTRSNGRKII